MESFATASNIESARTTKPETINPETIKPKTMMGDNKKQHAWINQSKALSSRP
jgi:hypothetical protein